MQDFYLALSLPRLSGLNLTPPVNLYGVLSPSTPHLERVLVLGRAEYRVPGT